MPNSSLPELPDDNEFVIPICSIFRRFLKDQGLKFTTERAKILDLVTKSEGVFEVDELLDELRKEEIRVSRATVYRTIKHLIEAGIIQEVLLGTKQTHYQLAHGRKQHDHIVNADNGQITEFHNKEVEALVQKICDEHNFKMTGHNLVIYGIPKS